jgi:hypothetical protein
MTDREPVSQAVHYIIRALDVIVKMANNPATFDEVAAEEEALWRAKCRLELLTSRIRKKQDARIRVVQ